jgi:hypothetical protein
MMSELHTSDCWLTAAFGKAKFLRYCCGQATAGGNS